MKKNTMMRIASVLLVAVLISTCAISGTFAKYVTKVSGEDTARVAKWGIVLDVEGQTVFADKYATDETGSNAYEGEYSVVMKADDADVAANITKVVAPGTSSEGAGDDILKASVKGTPEVATRFALEVTKWSDVVLPAGEGYTDYTELVKSEDGTYGYTNTFDLDKPYAPVKWNLIISNDSKTLNLAEALYAELPANLIAAAESYGLTEEGCSIFDAIAILKKVADSATYISVVESAIGQVVKGGSNFQLEMTENGLKMSYDFDPNKAIDYTFELSWEWAFEQENVELYDKADTLLGNIAAGVEGIVVPEGASTVINATITASATQID